MQKLLQSRTMRCKTLIFAKALLFTVIWFTGGRKCEIYRRQNCFFVMIRVQFMSHGVYDKRDINRFLLFHLGDMIFRNPPAVRGVFVNNIQTFAQIHNFVWNDILF